MTESQIEQRKIALAYSHGLCEICSKPLVQGQIQGAHRIGNTIVNRKIYGDKVIDSPENIAIVCSLACNAKADISKNPCECAKIALSVWQKESQKYSE